MEQIAYPVAVKNDPADEIAALAARYRRANGPVMRLVNKLGGSLENQLALIPAPLRDQLERKVTWALEASYGLAGRAPEMGARGPMLAVVASGAAGGAGGIATSLAELPVTVTLILNAIRAAAAEAGLDPKEPWVQAECLRVFGAGSPLASDDGVNTSFLTARLTVTGAAVQNLISTIAPKLATVLGQKLAVQAVPVLGAVTGAALNAAFLNYYREVARIRFALLRLAEVHGADPVLQAFAAAVEPPKILKA
ncbi:staphylolytic protease PREPROENZYME LASA [Tabrizicola piscis]|uniref:Staphylolytic protease PREPROENZYME LASA n=1 Tax=Tabrizicola piscis TaxID=2494374 RepID=A0A3S8U2J6_9RHOB|nr:EcsC family protein [Tabrizicola piscis]AZL57840.1 staphylolytic protease PREPROENZYME LASA [Tabrizicola piscis]